MATSSVAQNVGPTAVKPRREMQEAKAPDQFQFTKIGQTIAGVLISIEPTTVRDKQALEYMLVNETGDRLTFLGTADLNKKVLPGHIGHWMEIRYDNDDTTFQKPGQSAMKVFKVMVSKQKEPGWGQQ